MRDRWSGVRGVARVELRVEFESSGWSDPGFASREPEGEETRTVTRVLVGGEELPPELTRLLAPHIADVVGDADVEDVRDA